MSASRQPVDAAFPDGGRWLSLVRDQGYWLFAAGHGRAVIVERLPLQPAPAKYQPAQTLPRTFDDRYGLKPNTPERQGRFVVMTEVSRASQVSRFRVSGADVKRGPRSSPWNAVRSIQSVNRLESYVAKEAGNLLFFLVRGPKSRTSLAPRAPERPDASAMQIGRSLGLSDTDLEALRVAGLARRSRGELSSLDQGEGNEAPRCKCPGCEDSPAATLEGQPYCKLHFMSACYQRLDACAEQLGQGPVAPELADQMRSLLTACIEQANALTRAPFSQDSLERARLLDIRHTALELKARLRRSPRFAASHPVRLLCETPGRPWQEESQTFLISRFGAMLECKNLVRPDDWLFVERLDTGSRARARMAWRGPGKSGSFCVGLEFLDSENFWGLSWTDPVPACPDGGRARSLSAG
ncbi:MAG TPA: hypothetical protein VJX29_00140 [Candidatus Acidoferrales bacterium]|nr:hypothetical protein [Candidatus Acidoferrales bacterium]